MRFLRLIRLRECEHSIIRFHGLVIRGVCFDERLISKDRRFFKVNLNLLRLPGLQPMTVFVELIDQVRSKSYYVGLTNARV